MIDFTGPAERMRLRYQEQAYLTNELPGCGTPHDWELVAEFDKAARLLEQQESTAALARLWGREFTILRKLWMRGRGWTTGTNRGIVRCSSCRVRRVPREAETFEFRPLAGEYYAEKQNFTAALCIRHDVRFRPCARRGWPVIMGECIYCGQEHRSGGDVIHEKMVARGEPA